MYQCLGVLITHNLALNDIYMAHHHIDTLLAILYKDAFTTSTTVGVQRLFERTIVPRLQDLVKADNITCDGCNPNPFQTLVVAKSLDKRLCNDSNEACVDALKLAKSSIEKITWMYSIDLEQLGTLVS